MFFWFIFPLWVWGYIFWLSIIFIDTVHYKLLNLFQLKCFCVSSFLYWTFHKAEFGKAFWLKHIIVTLGADYSDAEFPIALIKVETLWLGWLTFQIGLIKMIGMKDYKE